MGEKASLGRWDFPEKEKLVCERTNQDKKVHDNVCLCGCAWSFHLRQHEKLLWRGDLRWVCFTVSPGKRSCPRADLCPHEAGCFVLFVCFCHSLIIFFLPDSTTYSELISFLSPSPGISHFSKEPWFCLWSRDLGGGGYAI